MTEDHNEQQEMIINQEYKLWKKSAPFRYDFSLIRSLQWPSATFQWLPDYETDQSYYNYFALISSNAGEGEQSELQKIKVKIPRQNCVDSYIQNQEAKVQIVSRKALGSEINRARYCYAQPNLVATTHASGQILITYEGEICLKLLGHLSQGYGLSWNPISKQYLASGQSDKRICIWDVEKARSESNKLSPMIEILYHGAPVEDVAWHKMHPNIFGSCSDDRMIMLWDMRFRSAVNQNSRKPLFEIIGHTNEIYSLDFSPFSEFLFLSGSSDESVSIWDMRNLTRSVETIQTKQVVTKVEWSPHSINLFASCGSNHTVKIWDMSLLTNTTPLNPNKKDEDSKLKEKNDKADKQKENEKQKGQIFNHDGHRSKVVDFDWNPNERLLLGSVQQANCVHVWEMKKNTYYQ